MQKLGEYNTKLLTERPANRPLVYSKKRNNTVPYQTPVGFQREIRPCVDIQIDIRQILDRKRLEQDPSYRGERLAKRLFLPITENLPAQQTVYLRVLPQSSHIVYELADPLAHDLKRCDYLFSQIVELENHSGFLEELAAPSFSGKQAISVVRNVMALGNLTELLFIDGSIRLPCCPSGCLTSLRLTGAVCSGRSWYEEQGATAKISKKMFQHLSFADFIDAVSGQRIEDPATSTITTPQPSHYERLFLEYDADSRVTKTRDLDLISFQQSSRMQREWQPSRKAYTESTQFVHGLQISQLTNCLSSLCTPYPQLRPLCEALQNASDLDIAPDGRLGTLLTELLKTKEQSSHQLLHEFLESLITDKDSIFFQYITDSLDPSRDPSDLSLMLAFCVVHTFFKDLEAPLPMARQSLYELLKANETERLIIAKKIGPLRAKTPAQIIKELDACTEIAFIKVWSHSTRHQQERYWQYKHEIGTTDEFHAAERAIQFISKQSVHRLRSIYKNLAEAITTRFRLSEMDILAGITLEKLMDTAGSDGQTWILDELLCGSLKHISTLLVQHFHQQTAIFSNNNELYELFMICKYIVKNREIFTLTM